jgi:feruloyl esterase
MNLAMERWVEKGTAPERLLAARYREGSDPASGVVRTRPLCPYPQIARYKGEGSTDEAASFACVRPNP